MNIFIEALEVELAAARTEVAFLVIISFEVAVDRRDHGEAPDVEFATFVEQRLLDVLLDDVAAVAAVHVGAADQRLDMVEVPADLDAAPAVRVLAWLDDPEVAAEFRAR